MASASALNLSIRRSKSNTNANNNNNDHQQNGLRQLRGGNCRSVSMSHLAPLKALHAHEVRPPMKSSSTAAPLSPLMDTPHDFNIQGFGSLPHNNALLLPSTETSTPVPHYFVPICPVPLPPLYGLPIVQDDTEEELLPETYATPCRRKCCGTCKFDSCSLPTHH